MFTVDYNATPTISKFHGDNGYFRCLKGPVGSGKSSGSIVEILLRAAGQQPDSNGVRKTRCAVIRATYPELRSTTIKTFEAWIPPSIAPVVYTAPIVSRIQQRLGDGTIMDCEVVFLALDRPEDVSKLLSLELTFAWINECSQIDEDIFRFLRGRIGRYPKKENGIGPTWRGIWADYNPPKTSHWLYRVFEEEASKLPKGWKLFVQPPAVHYADENSAPEDVVGRWALNPDAENLENLVDGYYRDQIEGNSEEYIRVMLAGEYGVTLSGKAVFPQFSTQRHVSATPLAPSRAYPIVLGFDWGLHPACVAAQITGRGVRCLEASSPADESLEDFLDDYVLPLLRSKYPNYKIIAVGDPAGRGRSGLDKRTAFDIMKARGIKAFPAHTNSFVTRKEAVDWFLDRHDGLLVSTELTLLREAFAGGYHYAELKTRKGVMKDTPDKNEYSHAMDALQYLCLWARYARSSVTGHQQSAAKEEKPRVMWA